MRSVKLAIVSAMSLFALAGCNAGQPRIYRVAIDNSAVVGLNNPSCFVNNILPSTGGALVQEQNYREQQEWVIWDGDAQKEYLDIGEKKFRLGDSPTIRVDELIEGTNKSFSALRNTQNQHGGDFNEVRGEQIAIKFNDYSFSPTGTIGLSAQYACVRGRTECPKAEDVQSPVTGDSDAASCSVSLGFVARKIDADQLTAYGNDPGQQ